MLAKFAVVSNFLVIDDSIGTPLPPFICELSASRSPALALVSAARILDSRIKKIGQPTWSGILTHVGGSKVIEEPSYDEEGIALANWQLEWVGDITSFTLNLASVADNNNYYSIDWIAVGRPSPAASHAALLRESSCLLYTSPSPRDGLLSRMPSSA